MPPRPESLVGGRLRPALLVLNGARAVEVREARLLARGRLLTVAVDGGYRACRRAGVEVDLVVGDRDSAGRLPGGLERVDYSTDKAFSDLAGALRELERRRVNLVLIAGLLGGRLDHEWANLLEVDRNARAFDAVLAPTTRGTVLFTSRGCRLSTEPGRTFSMLALTGSATVTLRGSRWTLERRRLRPGSRGLSNVTGKRLELIVHRGSVVLVPLPV